MRLLFLSYNGTTDPLFHTQGMAYLETLWQKGIKVHVLTYERRQGSRREERVTWAKTQADFAQRGIVWHHLRYHKVPAVLSTVIDIICGIFYAWYVVLRYRVTILHARGTIPSTVAAPVARLTGTKWLLDLRGLVSEEYVDGGLWERGSWRHRVVQRVERSLIRHADAVVVLTARAARILTEDTRWQLPPGLQPTVIPCCVDFTRMKRAVEESMTDIVAGAEGDFTLVYLGSVGTWYLLGEMIAFFQVLRVHVPQGRLLIITPREHHAAIYHALRSVPEAKAHVTVVAAPPSLVPRYLRLARAGLAMIKPAFSKQFSSPTKIGEYLAMGMPIIVNSGVGDLDAFIEEHRVGVVLYELSPEGYRQGVNALMTLLQDDTLAARCRDVARTQLSVTLGRQRYWQVYQSMMSTDPTSVP